VGSDVEYTFAAVEFSADENLYGRSYWYVCDFAVEEGEEVLAPVGPHSKLQRALVVRTMKADEASAPYDLRLVKKIAARYGDREIVLSGFSCFELGGIRYDEKHYTRFRKIFTTDAYRDMTDRDVGILEDLGVKRIVDIRANACRPELWRGSYISCNEEEVITQIAEEKGGALLIGDGNAGCVSKKIIRMLRENGTELPPRIYDKLREKLS